MLMPIMGMTTQCQGWLAMLVSFGRTSHPQVSARNMVVTVEDEAAGTLKLAGNPLKMSAFEDKTTRAPAPALDADRARILKELGIA